MKHNKSVYTIGLFVLLAVGIGGFFLSRGGGNLKKPLGLDGAKPRVVVFYENGWASPLHGSSLPSLKKHVQMIDEVSPFWFTVNMDGTIEDKHNQEAMDFARANQIPVMALFNNKKGALPTNDGMLKGPARTKSIAEIIRLVDKYDYDGINIDFEVIPAESKEQFTAYVAELADKLKSQNKKMAVSVIPQVGTTADISGVYDYAALAGVSDQIVLMAYNEHYPASQPGPVASIPWVDENIKDALERIPRDKLVLGLALYGYDWPGPGRGTAESVDYIPMTEAAALAGRQGVTVQWDDKAQVPNYQYSDGGVQRQVWYENDKSLRAKLGLVRKYSLPGVALWRIGFEDEAVWQIIGENLGN